MYLGCGLQPRGSRFDYLYTAAAFFHFKATGSLKRHRAYHAAYNSDTFSVEFEADYESGELTISVEEEDCHSEFENV